MTAETDFYDEAMTAEGARALLPAADSPWLPVYQEAAKWLEGSEPLVDLGCGTGRFPVVAADADHSGGYLGIDFSPAAIDEATRYLAYAKPGYDCKFEVADLREWVPPDIRPGATTYVCLEVLEHLDDDLEIVAKVPAGHRLLFSVPNYGSAAHVRRFPSPASVWERYGALLSFRRWTLIGVGTDGKAIHVLDTTRRPDSWD